MQVHDYLRRKVTDFFAIARRILIAPIVVHTKTKLECPNLHGLVAFVEFVEVKYRFLLALVKGTSHFVKEKIGLQSALRFPVRDSISALFVAPRCI